MSFDDTRASRRALLKSAGALAGFALVQGCARHVASPVVTAEILPATPFVPPAAAPVPAVATATPIAPKGVSPALFERARAALDRHSGRVAKRDMIAIADFDAASHEKRFQFVHLESGTVTAMLVAHGSGSDPAHSGKLQRFSNTPDSNATCDGAFLTDAYYVGQHGRSQRLIGLDPTNDNALSRAIVVHAAWYANPDVVASMGKLGRSQGCFAVGDKDLARVFALMGEGRMIYAGKA